MKWRDLSKQECSLARALAVVGDRWTLLILRDAFLRVRRFDDFQSRLGIARRVLVERLSSLVDEGVLEKIPYHQRPTRYEYRLTQKGLDLYPVILSLVHWGDAHFAGGKSPPVAHRHKNCGHHFRSVLTCSSCGDTVDAHNVEPIAAHP
jgi:DNA-binding HxlR family transcriptional regulator